MSNEEKRIPLEENEETQGNGAPAAPAGEDTVFYTKPIEPPAKKAEDRPTRRVGTLTMGFSLIAVGIVSLISLFDRDFDWTLVAKFSPIILVLLGCEVLFRYVADKGAKLKYDFLSGFVCLCLILGSVAASTVPYYFRYYGPGRERVEARISQELEEQFYAQLGNGSGIQSFDVSVYLADQKYDEAATVEDLRVNDRVHITAHFGENTNTIDAFVAHCAAVLEKAKDMPNASMRFYFTGGDDEKEVYTLQVEDTFQRNMGTDALKELVEVIPVQKDQLN